MEHVYLNELFSEGLEYFHLRKPEQSIDEFRRYLDVIKPEFHRHIMLHQHQELLNEYEIKGVHLQEQVRKSLFDHLQDFVAAHQNLNLMVSSSFHEVEDIKESAGDFDYVLLSPVFDAISKPGYEGRSFDVKGLDHQIIGMGGIKIANVEATRDRGFSGVGVLGSIWNSEDPVSAFRELKKEADRVFRA